MNENYLTLRTHDMNSIDLRLKKILVGRNTEENGLN